ncbi:hypothetical protein RCZ04_12430 [Capnocytophaga sp. HP1101]
MSKNSENIAGLPPYERGYHAMGYLDGMPSLRIVAMEEENLSPSEPIEILYQNIENFTHSNASCKSLLITVIDTLPQALSLKEAQFFYIPASLLLENTFRETFINNFTPNNKLRILVDSTHNGFEIIAMLRSLRALAQLPITCLVHSITDYLYALIAQADDLICDIKNKELTSPESQLLIENSLITKTIDPFFP